jgi:predicted metal-binding protein
MGSRKTVEGIGAIRAANCQKKAVEKVVKGVKRVRFAEVIENAEKINFQKCPFHSMQRDIMVT